ncbi:transmembrane protein 208 [Haematobia irritans]|uniref:Transmembrane protein 208 n=2 Tax=Haematobia irritans TaxID=7368 RepID=A0A1L8ECQ4_HAEIR
MAPQQKGKQGTKGQKQIVEENKSTLVFYRNMALGSAATSILVNFLFFEIGKTTVIMSILSVLALGAAYQFMAFMSKAKYSETGALLDSGNDLNMKDGIGENAKDLIILTSGTMLLSILSNYFWFLILLAPCWAVYKLWGSVIQPWLAQKNETDEPEINEKKQRKMERRMRRQR